MDTETAENEAKSLRKLIRSIDFARPLDKNLNERLVDIDAIRAGIQRLAEMGESTREFDTYITSLLLSQCEDLSRMKRRTKEWWKIFEINQILEDSREYLWPTRN